MARKGNPLTESDRRLAALLAEGKTTGEAAYEMGLQSKAVASQALSLYRKVGVASRVELTHWALHEGLVGNLFQSYAGDALNADPAEASGQADASFTAEPGDRVEVRGRGSSTGEWFPGAVHHIAGSCCDTDLYEGRVYSIQMDDGPLIHSVYPWRLRKPAGDTEAR